MVRRSLISLFIVAALGTLVHAGPTTYSGSLTSADGGLVGTGGWGSDPDNPVTLSWTVTQNADLSWHYHYVFDSTGLQGELSHLVLETSANFTANDISNDVPSVENEDPKWHTESNGNPNIPAPVFGIRFEDVSGAVVTMDFDSPREPMWGDFFAKSGAVAGELWNAGFTFPDTDPIAPPQNGSLQYHVLVPDTATSTIPAPGAVLLGSVGTGLVSWLRRRRAL